MPQVSILHVCLWKELESGALSVAATAMCSCAAAAPWDGQNPAALSQPKRASRHRVAPSSTAKAFPLPIIP